MVTIHFKSLNDRETLFNSLRKKQYHLNTYNKSVNNKNRDVVFVLEILGINLFFDLSKLVDDIQEIDINTNRGVTDNIIVFIYSQ